jgi:hypothetical protein
VHQSKGSGEDVEFDLMAAERIYQLVSQLLRCCEGRIQSRADGVREVSRDLRSGSGQRFPQSRRT